MMSGTCTCLFLLLVVGLVPTLALPSGEIATLKSMRADDMVPEDGVANAIGTSEAAEKELLLEDKKEMPFKLLAPAPPHAHACADAPSHGIALLLQIFLGVFGAGYAYVGKWGMFAVAFAPSFVLCFPPLAYMFGGTAMKGVMHKSYQSATMFKEQICCRLWGVFSCIFTFIFTILCCPFAFCSCCCGYCCGKDEEVTEEEKQPLKEETEAEPTDVEDVPQAEKTAGGCCGPSAAKEEDADLAHPAGTVQCGPFSCMPTKSLKGYRKAGLPADGEVPADGEEAPAAQEEAAADEEAATDEEPPVDLESLPEVSKPPTNKRTCAGMPARDYNPACGTCSPVETSAQQVDRITYTTTTCGMPPGQATTVTPRELLCDCCPDLDCSCLMGLSWRTVVGLIGFAYLLWIFCMWLVGVYYFSGDSAADASGCKLLDDDVWHSISKFSSWIHSII